MKELIAIEWIDAAITIDGDSYSEKDAGDVKLIHGFAVGVLVKEFPDRYVISRDWFDEHDTYRGVASYPKTGIIKVKRHKLAKPKAK